MAKILYFKVEDSLSKDEKFKFLNNSENVFNVDFKELTPNKNYVWLTEGLENDFELLIPLDKRYSDFAIFELSSNGVSTSRDNWSYNFSLTEIQKNSQNFIQNYNQYVTQKILISDTKLKFDDKKVKWGEKLLKFYERGLIANYSLDNIKKSFYRPFTKEFLYYDEFMIERLRKFPKIFPTPDSEKENMVICLSGIGSSKPFQTLMVNLIPCLDILEKTQCFPFYTYNEDGTGRKENISDWALSEFRSRYSVVGSQLSVIGSQLSVVGSQLSVVGSRSGEENSENKEQNSVVGNQLSVIGSQLSVVGNRKEQDNSENQEQNSVVGNQLSVIGSQLSVVGSRSGEDNSENRQQTTEYRLPTTDYRLPRTDNNIKNNIEVDDNEISELQGSGSLAESNGFSCDDLQTNEKATEVGDIRSNQPDAEGSGFNSIEYSGGSGKEHEERVSAISNHSEGFSIGAGNSNDSDSQAELRKPGGFIRNMEASSSNWKVTQRVDTFTEIGSQLSVVGSRSGEENSENKEQNSVIGSQLSVVGSRSGEDNSENRQQTTEYRLPTTDYHQQITKLDIFYYIYAILHKPEYREKYAANLRRSLPRIPMLGLEDIKQSSATSDAELFWKYSEAGKKLADLHLNYEEQPEYPLTKIENKGMQLDWRVEKMKYVKSDDGRLAIKYNDFLTIAGIPAEVKEYKLGNRSALDWIIDQYRVKTDKRSGITNDPFRPDEPDYIVRLIGKIVTVSLETMKIVRGL